MRVELSRRAREDIFELADYASDYSDGAVYRIADEVDKSMTLLSEFPEVGRARPEFGAGNRGLVNRPCVCHESRQQQDRLSAA